MPPSMIVRWVDGLRPRCILAACILTLAFQVAPAARANDTLDGKINADIPANTSLEDALIDWGVKTGVTVMFNTSMTRGKVTQGIHGNVSARDALLELLRDSGLGFKQEGQRVLIVPSAGLVRSSMTGTTLELTAQPASDAQDQSNAREVTTATAIDHEKTMSQVIITAQKRSERLQDVPVPVTVLDAGALAERGQDRLQDYFATVPGLSLNSGAYGGGGQQNIVIRGLTTASFSNPTVAVTIDDVPYGSSTAIAWGAVLFPDIDPSDLDRIEVLRGPQGTLYGANSMGGLIKFVTKDPSTSGVLGQVQVLGSGVEHGDLGYAVRGSVNFPLSDTLAIRASGFARRDPGYIENVLSGQNDVDRADVSGGRVSVLWNALDRFAVKFSALLQNTEGYGSPAIDTDSSLNPTLGDLGHLKQSRIPGGEYYSHLVQLYTSTFSAHLSTLDLTSISSYGINRYKQLQDVSGNSNFASEPLYGVQGTIEDNRFETKKFTEELRLSSASGNRVEWLTGFYFTHEASPSDELQTANDLATGAPAGLLIDFNYPSTISEYSLFGDLTFNVTDKFDVQIGGRKSFIRQSYKETDAGPGVPYFDNGAISPLTTPTLHVNGNAFTYLVTPQFKFTRDLMIYARLASGYRIGGTNGTDILFPGLPTQYNPDKTNNYEIGFKGSILDHRLTLDASVYYIDWRHIQIYVIDPVYNVAYNSNGGTARSKGLELSIQAHPIDRVRITATSSLNDAELAQDLPASALSVGFSGDRLPYSARFMGSLSAEEDLYKSGRLTMFTGQSVSYVGNRLGEFGFLYAPTTPRIRFPSYAQFDLRAGAAYSSWSFNVFANNVANRRGIVGGGQSGAESPYYAVFIQPRTIGLSVDRSF